MQAGWSQRRPLSWVVHDEEYGNRALPGEEPHDLLEETLRGIRPLDAKALGEAWERQKRMTKPAGALGMLEIISAQLSGLSPAVPAADPRARGRRDLRRRPRRARPGRHPLAAGGHRPDGGQLPRRRRGLQRLRQPGRAPRSASSTSASPPNCPPRRGCCPARCGPGTADFTDGPGDDPRGGAAGASRSASRPPGTWSPRATRRCSPARWASPTPPRRRRSSPSTPGRTPPRSPAAAPAINDEMHARKVEVVRAGAGRCTGPIRPTRSACSPRSAGSNTPRMVGLSARRRGAAYAGRSWTGSARAPRRWSPAPSRPRCWPPASPATAAPSPATSPPSTTLGLRPLVDLDLRLGEGTGALLALPLVQSAARVMHEVATFDAAGVTEKS